MTNSLSSILVANRGEIARRIFRTARAMGLRCVAVHVAADAEAPFVLDADIAVRLDSSYLDGPAIIDAARRAGADAIHPGYGFLSENAEFAAAVTAAGLTWVGPAPDVIATMGDKLAAKQAAIEADVSILPSSPDPGGDEAVGYPLLVKAAAGGGGKGMRLVETPDQLRSGVEAAQREALSGFGDDTVFLERFVPRSRHVEIQILGDAHGNIVHLGERECSIQRRHQKIIEESPSPAVDAEMRSSMGDAALRLAQSIGYQSAGTVEFLVDEDTRDFYFLEVNTRLQVEHPVTELVTGIDLVREQIRLASGAPLGYGQDDIEFGGHSIEARLYAEDPAHGFLPAIGTVDVFEPAVEPPIRWDSGIESGSVVGVEFDPMLAKAVSHAPTRQEAAARLALGLERLHLGGVVTNRAFLAATLRSPEFLAGDTTTDFIERVKPATEFELSPTDLHRAGIAGALWLQQRNRADADVLSSMPSGFRVSHMPPQQVVLACREQQLTVAYQRRRDGSFQVATTVDGAEPSEGNVRLFEGSKQVLDIEVDSVRADARITSAGDQLHVQLPRGTVTFTIQPRFSLPGSDGPAGGLVAPMPGVVLEVRCAPGDTVTAGQTLVVLEAMKMEHHMNAPADGVVGEVLTAVGAQVGNGELLVVFEHDDDATTGEAAL